MTSKIRLRRMQPSDSPAIQLLMETDPDSDEMSLTTKFLVDPYSAWSILKMDMVGVVALDDELVVGCATVSFENINFDDRILPSAFLENLKVHHEYRGHGIASRMVQWLIDVIRERYADEVVIMTGTSADNTASQATMKSWATQVSSRLTVLPFPMLDTPSENDLILRPATSTDIAEIVRQSNQFYSDFSLYTVLTPEIMQHYLASDVFHYRVAVNDKGVLLAGILLSERAALLVDEFRNVPPPLRASGMIPEDNIVRTLEATSLWYTNPDAGEALWQYVRWEFRERCNSIIVAFDFEGPLKAVYNPAQARIQIQLVMSINGPTSLDENQLITNILRG